eukprot:14978291-Alexandrium_andersonii.AAC.1
MCIRDRTATPPQGANAPARGGGRGLPPAAAAPVTTPARPRPEQRAQLVRRARAQFAREAAGPKSVSYTHLRAHETSAHL